MHWLAEANELTLIYRNLYTFEKRIQAFETKCLRKLLCICYLWHKTNGWVGSMIGKCFWQLSRDGNSHGSGMSHATTASLRPFFRAPLKMGDAMAGKGNAGWTTSKSGHPCLSQNW